MGGGGGGKTQESGTTTHINKVELPPWVTEAAQSNLAFANRIAAKPYQEYKGDTVASLSPEFWKAQGKLGGLDDYYSNYTDASGTLRDLGNYQSGGINSRDVANFTERDLSKYLNPYIDNVERYAVENAQRAGQQGMTNLASEAQKKGAFGGTRFGVQQAVQGAETARNVGEVSAKLRQQGYDSATGLAMKDAEQQIQEERLRTEAQTANERAKAEAAGIRRGSATDLADVADQGQKARMNEMLQYLGIGEIRQGQQQRELDDKYRRWQEKQGHDLEDLNILLATLGMTPYGRTESGSSTSNSVSKSSSSGGFGDMLGQGLGIMKLLGGLAGASDRSLKTDIEKLGTDPETELPIYAYRYKKDPKRYPKTVGPMAQDVEKKYPHLVRKVGGKRVIDLTSLVG